MTIRLIFLGPPGAGKGTQASILANSLQIPHISTGELLRQERRNKTERGLEAQSYIDKGALVPDRVVMEIVQEELTKAEAKAGWILDGFPRNVCQAGALDGLLMGMGQPSCDCVISMEEVPESFLVYRLGKRAVEEKRTDDTPDVLRNRLHIYHEETAPLLKFYNDRLMLVPINGFQSLEKVTAEIKDAIEGEKELQKQREKVTAKKSEEMKQRIEKLKDREDKIDKLLKAGQF